MRSLPPCLPLDCSQLRTGRTAARPASRWLCVSSRHVGLDLMNCSVAVSTCPAYDIEAELLLVTTQTRTSLHVVVVLTFVVTVFTDTASIADQADLLFVVILVRESSSFSHLLLWPCKFKSSSPRPHREHRRLLPVLLRLFLAFINLLDFVVRVGCLLRFDRAFGFCSILLFVCPSKFSCWSNGRSSCCHRRLPVSSARSTRASCIQTICS